MFSYRLKLRVPLILECPFCKKKISLEYKKVFSYQKDCPLSKEEERKIKDQEILQFNLEFQKKDDWPFLQKECIHCQKEFPWWKLQRNKSHLFVFFFLNVLLFLTSFAINFTLKDFFHFDFIFMNYFIIPLIVLFIEILLSILMLKKHKKLQRITNPLSKNFILLNEQVKLEAFNEKP